MRDTSSPHICSSPQSSHTLIDSQQKIRALAKLVSNHATFPTERLEYATFDSLDGREQLIDHMGGFVITDIAALPTGGHSRYLKVSDQFRALLLGDMGSKNRLRQNVFKRVAKLCNSKQNPHCAAMFGLGDWLYPHGPISQDVAEVQRTEYHITNDFSKVSPHIPKFGVLGNHEYGIPGFPANPSAFMTLASRANIQFPGRYYSLHLESTSWAGDFLALDSSTLACDPEQVDWFQQQVTLSKQKEISEKKKRWRVVLAHHPLVSYGLHFGETEYLIDILGDSLNDIDLYCCGHEHDLEFIQTKNLPPVLLSGTTSERRFVESAPMGSFTSDLGGFASLDISQHKLNIRFHLSEGRDALYEQTIKR